MNELTSESIIAKLTAFQKERCTKKDLLTEMLHLQDQMVRIAFDIENTFSTYGLRILDVVDQLSEMNTDLQNIANDQLKRFSEMSTDFNNLIRAEISGKAGERKLSNSIQSIRCHNETLTNIELNTGTKRTELDAIIITKHGIIIAEAKNTLKDVMINQDGYCIKLRKRNGVTQESSSGNIAKKMAIKENILKKILKNFGIDNVPIRTCVVFTNAIDIRNECSAVETCLLERFPQYVDTFKSDIVLSKESITNIQMAIDLSQCVEEYPFGFDVSLYKKIFADLMITLTYGKSTESQYCQQPPQYCQQQPQYYEQQPQYCQQQPPYYEQQPRLLPFQPEYWGIQPMSFGEKCIDTLQSIAEDGIRNLPTLFKYTSAAVLMTPGIIFPVAKLLGKKNLLW